jgi:hypothetical protein
VFRVRSGWCVDTNITRRPCCRRISCLYLSNMRYQLSLTSMDPCKATNKQHWTDVLQITGPLESPGTSSNTQQDKTWVERTCWLSFIPLWLEAYYVFFRTFHFSLSSSSPFPQQPLMAPQTPQPSGIESELSRTTGASLNAPLAETQQRQRHQLVLHDAAIAATENMSQNSHLHTVLNTVRSNNKKQHVIWCE